MWKSPTAGWNRAPNQASPVCQTLLWPSLAVGAFADPNEKSREPVTSMLYVSVTIRDGLASGVRAKNFKVVVTDTSSGPV